MQRRSFLKLLGLGGAAAATGAVIVNRDKFESLSHDGQYRVSQSKRAIGTQVDITAIGASKAQTEDAVIAAFEDVAAMERMFTRFDNMSPVSEANALSHLDHVPAEMASLLQTCDYYYRDTQGAFDITVKPVLDLMQKAARENRNPSESEIEDILPFIGADKLNFHDNKLALRENMGITLDGATPGFIADRIANILEQRGIAHYLVNAGGEIRVSGHPQNANTWRVAIQDPQKKGNYPGVLALNNGAVSTSGNYEIFFGNDKVFHHIVDAHTGKSPDMASVTVIAPTALQADILSTAFFVMSKEQALGYCQSHPDVACLLIDNEGRQTASSNFTMV
ncbi:MAG: FAD:protein FMN transferase [Proteobacteria bacterium]|nr:FAD:protein FMN transferase [Pseudomonadota bacterium]